MTVYIFTIFSVVAIGLVAQIYNRRKVTTSVLDGNGVPFLENNAQYAFVSSLMNLYDKCGVYRTIMYREKPSKESFIKGSQFCHAGCMMRTEAVKAVGGYSESMDYKRVEDFDLWVRMYKK